mgnify:CR=1 FL=1
MRFNSTTGLSQAALYYRSRKLSRKVAIIQKNYECLTVGVIKARNNIIYFRIDSAFSAGITIGLKHLEVMHIENVKKMYTIVLLYHTKVKRSK